MLSLWSVSVSATDIDKGDNGRMTFSVDDPNFRVESNDGKHANIITTE